MVKKGTETRDWTYVDDIMDGLLAMGLKEEAVSALLKKQKEEKNAAPMEFEDGLKKVHEWFAENREDVERSAEF